MIDRTERDYRTLTLVEHLNDIASNIKILTHLLTENQFKRLINKNLTHEFQTKTIVALIDIFRSLQILSKNTGSDGKCLNDFREGS